MRKPSFAAGLAALLIVGLAGGGWAKDYRLAALRIGQPWSLPAPAGAPTAAIT
jgi:hypothetical protein